MWVERLVLTDLRNIREADIEMGPGLNVFVGRNAQGKTSLLEGVGLLARGRSFRTEETPSVIRHGAPGMRARGSTREAERRTTLEIEVAGRTRRLRVDGREVPPREYYGRLEAVVYSTDRLRVVWGPMRERRQFVDRSASALWPSYRQTVREYDRVLLQRNAALESGGRGLEVWDERYAAIGTELRERRARYVRRLNERLREGFRPEGEEYAVELAAAGSGEVEATAETLRSEMQQRRRDELRSGRSLVGPHRDPVTLRIDGRESREIASSGQARSLLLALAVAALEIYREERGDAAVALLDDLDSELDEERATAMCERVVRHGQALVTTAHPGWGRRLATLGKLYEVTGGEVKAA